MVWGPLAMAAAFGLLISAAIYFALVWPRREPDETDEPGGRRPGDGAP